LWVIYDAESSRAISKSALTTRLRRGVSRFNGNLSKYRVFIEHVNRCIKRFKMFQYRYRNKQRKHLLRISLVCGIYNYELRF